jgi:hypothetical protein
MEKEMTTLGISTEKSRDADHWAQPVSRLKVSDVPAGAINLNLEGRRVTGPLQGFGQVWQRTYRVRLDGVEVTPEQVVQDWKENFARYQPSHNHFYPPTTGIEPGGIMFIDTRLPILPGLPGILPLAVGVMVFYADEEMFTVMTPEGHPLAGWISFGAYEQDGCTVVQVEGLCRPSDPIYDLGYRFMGGEAEEDKTWSHVLQALAARWGVQGQVQLDKTLLDPRVQWSAWKNVWNNSAIRTTLHTLAAPLRWAGSLFKERRATTVR